MARMSIDDMLGRDPRLLRLAKACGWSKRETAGCLVLDVWPLCYDRERHELADVDIDVAADMDGFAQLMVNAGLAARTKSGFVRVNGAKERIKYLQSKRAAGYRGGLKSGESRQKDPKQNSSTSEANSKQTASKGQARGNPSAPDLPSASAPSSAPVPVSDPPPALVLIPEGPAGPSRADAIDAFHRAFKKRANGAKPTWGDKQVGQMNGLLAKHSAAEVIRRIEILFTAPPAFLAGCQPDLGTLVVHFDKLATPAQERKSLAQSALDQQLERVRMLEEQERKEHGDD